MVEVRELSNGIRVVLEQMDHLCTASIGVWIKVGSAYEDENSNGMSHMLEHMFFKGTKKRTAKMLADDMAMIGGNFNACTCKEYTTFYTTTLSEHLGHGIEILGDMLCNSNFSEEDLEREKGVVLEEILMYEDSPEDLVHEMLQKTVWEDHPLGYLISGQVGVVSRFSRDDLLKFYETHYCAENFIISVAGRFNEDELMADLEDNFGKVKQDICVSGLTVPSYKRSLFIREKDIEQIHMNLAFPGTTINCEKKYAFAVANAILGGNDNSRLFQRIREELGMTYSIYSYDSPYLFAGLSHIDVVLKPENLEAVFDDIIAVIEDYRKKGMSGHELFMTKEQIRSELLISNESSRSHMEMNGKSMLYRGEPERLDDVIAKLAAVGLDDVKRSTEEFFDISLMSVSLVGNVDVPGTKYIKKYLGV